MAEENPNTQRIALSATGTVVHSSEIRAAFEGPAVYADRFIVTTNQAGLRIGFMETDNRGSPAHFRTAVILSYPDAIELSKLIRSLLTDIEKQIEEAKADGIKVSNG